MYVRREFPPPRLVCGSVCKDAETCGESGSMCGNAAVCAKMRERVPKIVNVFCENAGRVRKMRERMRAGGPLHMERAKRSFLWGAAVVSVGGLLAKVLGAFYRVPLKIGRAHV